MLASLLAPFEFFSGNGITGRRFMRSWKRYYNKMDKKFLVPFHDFSKDNFPIIKDGVYVINVNDKQSKESKETY